MEIDDFEAEASAFSMQIEMEIESAQINFPVSMDVSLRIKRLADDPDSTLEEIVAVVQADPLLSAKIVRMASSVVLNPGGAKIDSVRDAVQRTGLAPLRSLAFAVASEQLAADKRSPNMRALAAGLWMRTVEVASWAFVLARRTRAANPDAAMFAGMMSHIGQFFLVARASDYPAMERNVEGFAQWVDGLHLWIGEAVLEIFELPKEILSGLDGSAFQGASVQGDGEAPGPWPPQSLPQLITCASLLAEAENPFDALLGRAPLRGAAAAGTLGLSEEEINTLTEESRGEREQILAAVRG